MVCVWSKNLGLLAKCPAPPQHQCTRNEKCLHFSVGASSLSRLVRRLSARFTGETNVECLLIRKLCLHCGVGASSSSGSTRRLIARLADATEVEFLVIRKLCLHFSVGASCLSGPVRPDTSAERALQNVLFCCCVCLKIPSPGSWEPRRSDAVGFGRCSSHTCATDKQPAVKK